ncbi:MAG: hypothetical protein ACYC23_17025 [Limisphaerales bacterium]
MKRIMGEPDKTSKGINFSDWTYGKSSLRIYEDRVIKWTNHGELQISLEGEPADAVWIGCSTNQVAMVVGDPTQIVDFGSRKVWKLGNYSFRFSDDALTSIETEVHIEIPRAVPAVVTTVPRVGSPARAASPSFSSGYSGGYGYSGGNSGGGRVQVRGYYRKNGTYVSPHPRRAPSR